MTKAKKLILASKSARRRELLEMVGIPFEIRVSDAPEDDSPLDLSGVERCGDWEDDTGVTARVANIAVKKAQAVWAECSPAECSGECVILAADTVVALGDRLIGKPRDLDEARQILRTLSGNTHRVVTVYVVTDGRRTRIRPTVSYVTFRKLADREIEAYVTGCAVLDKAGAYGIQDKAALFVERIEGDFYNIVGLPVVWLREDLGSFGLQV